MRVYDQGCFVRVTVSESEVQDFKEQWPCSDLPSRAIGFLLDKRNGDLVDLWPRSVDGPAALALSHDASNYAAKKLNLPALAR